MRQIEQPNLRRPSRSSNHDVCSRADAARSPPCLDRSQGSSVNGCTHHVPSLSLKRSTGHLASTPGARVAAGTSGSLLPVRQLTVPLGLSVVGQAAAPLGSVWRIAAPMQIAADLMARSYS
jgi:hypothetical protein